MRHGGLRLGSSDEPVGGGHELRMRWQLCMGHRPLRVSEWVLMCRHREGRCRT